MTGNLSLDVGTAPPGALTRISAAINRRPKRVFGVLKIENEYVGYVRADRFEIWERRQRAVHAVGTVAARGGGSHIEVRFVLPTRTRVLVVLFFALYAVVAVELSLRSDGAVDQVWKEIRELREEPQHEHRDDLNGHERVHPLEDLVQRDELTDDAFEVVRRHRDRRGQERGLLVARRHDPEEERTRRDVVGEPHVITRQEREEERKEDDRDLGPLEG